MASGNIKDKDRYHVGDVIDLSGVYATAYGYASSATNIRCTLPLSKDIGSDITGFNTTCGVAWARGSSAHNISNPTISARIVTAPNQLYFELTVSGATAFETFVIAFGNGTVTFT